MQGEAAVLSWKSVGPVSYGRFSIWGNGCFAVSQFFIDGAFHFRWLLLSDRQGRVGSCRTSIVQRYRPIACCQLLAWVYPLGSAVKDRCVGWHVGAWVAVLYYVPNQSIASALCLPCPLSKGNVTVIRDE